MRIMKQLYDGVRTLFSPAPRLIKEDRFNAHREELERARRSRIEVKVLDEEVRNLEDYVQRRRRGA